MNKMISLIKVDINNTYGLSTMAHSLKDKKNRWRFIIFGILMMSLIPTYIMLIRALGNMYDASIQIGQRSYFLQMGIFASQILVFVFGIIYVMSKYYFSNDLDQLVPLPIKSSHILGSKFVTLMISEYLTSLPIILPFILIYGIRGKEGILYWIYSFLLALGIPVLPLVIASILVMIFMKYTNIKGKKDLLRIVGSSIFLFLILFIQFQMQSIMQKVIAGGDEFYINLAKNSNLLVMKLGVVFPPSMWGTLSLVNYGNFSGLSYVLLFFLVSIIGYIIMILLSEKIFFDGLIGNMEVYSSKSRGSRIIGIKDSIKINKPYISLAKKEVKILFRTPVYLLNSVGGVIILPAVLVMSTVTGDESLELLTKVLGEFPHFIVLPAIGMIVFLGMLNSIGCTTFSREGKNFWIQRTLPIRIEDQIIGRVLSSLIIQLVGIVAMISSIFFIAKIRLGNILIIAILGLLGSIPMTQIGMIIDILRPLLIWDNPQKAMKQNLNVLIGMGVGFLYGGILTFLTIKLFDKIDINYIYIILALIFILSSYILYIILKKLISKQFIELQ